MVGDSEYKPNWSKGYEFKPCRKHKNGNELYISFSGVIKNAGLSLRLSPDYDFDSLKKIGDNWSCFNSSTGNEEILHSPRVKLNSDLDGLQVDQNKEYETRADGKNLQPSGEIILSCEVIMPRIIEVAFTYNADDFHYDSIKMHYGKWVGLKK